MSTDSPASSPAASATPDRERGKVLAGWKKLLAHAAGFVLSTWAYSLRVTVSATSRQLLAAHTQPTLFLLWHNRLFFAGDLPRRFRDGRPLHALISASKDGAWLTAFFTSIGLSTVRGSSSRGGREAVGDLVRVLRSGRDAAITPDGPRGPLYTCKLGALVVARRAGVRVVVLGMNYESAWRLRSWDKFYLPRPFSQVGLCVREFTPADLQAEDAQVRLESTLRELNPDD